MFPVPVKSAVQSDIISFPAAEHVVLRLELKMTFLLIQSQHFHCLTHCILQQCWSAYSLHTCVDLLTLKHQICMSQKRSTRQNSNRGAIWETEGAYSAPHFFVGAA